jgi:hypothetical protein
VLGDFLPHVGHGLHFIVAEVYSLARHTDLKRTTRRSTRRRRDGWRGRSGRAAFSGRQNVTLADAAARARSRYLRKVNLIFTGDAPNKR